MKSPRSSLIIGERVASYCDGGLLEVEYALFDQDDVIVTASLGFGAREQGYVTTAKLARERLRAAGITAELVHDTFAAIRGPKLHELVRAPIVRQVVDQLTACEVFEGGPFSIHNRTYAGVWFNLSALANACPLAGAAHLIQALHLLSVLEDVVDDVPVRLVSADFTAGRRPGARTWSRVRFEGTNRLAWVLRAMPVPPAARLDRTDVRHELLANLRARTAVSLDRARLYAIAEVLTRAQQVTPPYASPFSGAGTDAANGAETASAALDKTPVSKGDSGVDVNVDAATADDPGLTLDELDEHTAMLKGAGNLEDVAQFLSAMSARSAPVPELAVLAARAWCAAGETGRARYLAKKVMRCRGAPSQVRLTAIEILKSTAPSNESSFTSPPSTEPIPVANTSPEPSAAPEASFPVSAPSPPSSRPPKTLRMSTAPPLPPTAATAADARHSPPPPPQPDTTAHVAPPPPRLPRFYPARSEIVESLSLPEGATEDMLPEGAPPRDPFQARIAMTRLARSLGRDYRLWYGTTLKTNAIAIDAMQHHLRRRIGDGRDPMLERHLEAELTRHGALLSEILARALGGVWIDVQSELPGQWAMMVPPDLRVWPIGRVYRFMRQGHREADLVAFYLELEEKGRAVAP